MEFCKQTHHAEDAEDPQLLHAGIRFETWEDGEEACYHNHYTEQAVSVEKESSEVSKASKATKATKASKVRKYLRRTGSSHCKRSHRTSLQGC